MRRSRSTIGWIGIRGSARSSPGLKTRLPSRDPRWRRWPEMPIKVKSKPDLSPKRIRKFVEPFLVPPGAKVRLPNDFDPASTGGYNRADGAGAQQILQAGITLLADYQAKVAAQSTHAVLVIVQAMDAAGKDGTIRHVMSGVNPQGVDVSGLKVPSADELEVHRIGCTRASLLGCLPGGIFGPAQQYQYQVGALVCGSGGQQVVLAAGSGRGHLQCAPGHRSAVSDGRLGGEGVTRDGAS